MTKEEKKLYQIDEFVQNFKDEFIKKFGILPKVSYDGYIPVPRVSLVDLEIACNIILNELKSPNYTFSDGLKSKSRKRLVVTIRQCFYKLGRDMGYTLETIADFLGFDHSTVLYGTRQVRILMDIKAVDIMLIMRLVEDEVRKQKVRVDGNIQSDSPEQDNS